MVLVSYAVIFFVFINVLVFSIIFKHLIVDRTTVCAPELTVVESGENVDYYCNNLNPLNSIIVISCGANGSYNSYKTIVKKLIENNCNILYIHRKKALLTEAIIPFKSKINDIKKAVLYLEKNGYKKENIVVLGHSLGGYSVVRLMKQKFGLRAVISVCGFYSWVELCRYYMKKYLSVFEKLFDPMFFTLSFIDAKILKNDTVYIINSCDSLTTKFYIIELQKDRVLGENLGLAFKKECITNSNVEFSKCDISDLNGHSTILTVNSNLIISKILDSLNK